MIDFNHCLCYYRVERKQCAFMGNKASMECPHCKSPRTSEYMENRWVCLKCDTKFLYEEQPSVVVQPVKIVHECSADTGIRAGGPGSCSRCGSDYVNCILHTVRDGYLDVSLWSCHNCGARWETVVGPTTPWQRFRAGYNSTARPSLTVSVIGWIGGVLVVLVPLYLVGSCLLSRAAQIVE